jgi:putative flippase GtrA
MSADTKQFIRFVINGLGATAVHFAVLVFNLEVLHMASAGLANMIAAVFGITASYLGSRFFVFQETGTPWVQQAMSFGLLYGAIAILHGLVLLVWTDGLGFAYQMGFLLATVFQVALSFLGNKFLVFAK